MKKIYSILLAASALFAFAPFALSQEPGEWSINGQINETVVTETGPKTKYLEWPKAAENGLIHPEGTDFAYSKDISAPQSDGTYWIKLESFATGAASRILTSTPSDIILVLDSSTSMNTNDYDEVTYTARGETDYSYSSYGNNNTYYYLFKGRHYAVSRGQSQGIYYLSFTADGTTYYLSGEGPTTTLSGANTNTGTIWRGVLYNRSTRRVTRIAALRNATKQFITNIVQNDAEIKAVDPSFAGNRIAIVSYDNAAHVLTSAWVAVGQSGAETTLHNAVDGMSLANWTRPDLGMSSAITNFLAGTGTGHTKRAEANLTVVMFTDGVPCHQSGSGSTFEAEDANKAIYQGYRLKHDYGATLFTVGLLSPTSTDQNIVRGRHFLDLLSSNYPISYIAQNSTSAWNINQGTITVNGMTGASAADKKSSDYYQLVDGDTDLSSIFDSISKQSGGSASELSASSRNVDVVSNSFILPQGTTAENIDGVVKIFVAKVSGYDATKQELTFYEEILKGHTPDEPVSAINGYYYFPLDENGDIAGELTKVDAGISVAFNPTTQAVTVTGFDYGSNFCGPVYESNYTPTGPDDMTHIDHWQGFKIIIMIPITMNPNAVGGPDVATNAPGSGIFVNNEDTQGLVQFKSPTVSLPVNIHLKKTGLGPGESAKFKIERAQLPDPIPENFDPATLTNWSYVSTVFVTRPEGSAETDPDPIIKVRGLPANMDETTGEGESATTVHKSFVYRVTEEGWSWSYTAQTPPQYTTTSNVTNPFTFDNLKKDNIDFKVRHAESKATNVFKPGIVTNNVKYDDSKTNIRSGGGSGSGSGSGSGNNQ